MNRETITNIEYCKQYDEGITPMYRLNKTYGLYVFTVCIQAIANIYIMYSN